MAQKSNPYAVRLGWNQTWNSYYFPESKAKKINWLERDFSIREYFNKLFPDASRLVINYNSNDNEVLIYLYMTDVDSVLSVLGWEDTDKKKQEVIKDVSNLLNDKSYSLKINLLELKKVYTEAQAVANLIAQQLKKRMKAKVIIKNVISKISLEREVKGVKIQISGRLDESDIAQRKKEVWGKMPLSTLDANIDVGSAEAITSYGKIGVKVLMYKGKIWKKSRNHVDA